MDNLLSTANEARSASDMHAAGLSQTNALLEKQLSSAQSKLSKSEQSNATAIANNSELEKQTEHANEQKTIADGRFNDCQRLLDVESGKVLEQKSRISELESEFQSQTDKLVNANHAIEELKLELQVAKTELHAIEILNETPKGD